MPQEQRYVGVALAGEVRELAAHEPARIGGQAAVAVGERIALDAGRELVGLAVENGLEAALLARAVHVRELERLDGARAIEIGDVVGAKTKGRDHGHPLELVRVVETLLARVHGQGGLVHAGQALALR